MKEIRALFNIIILFSGLAMLISGGSCAVITVYDGIKASDGYLPLRIFIWFVAVEIALIGWWLIMVLLTRSEIISTEPKISRIKHCRSNALFLMGLNTLIFGSLCVAFSLYETIGHKHSVDFYMILLFGLLIAVIGCFLIRSSFKSRKVYVASEAIKTNGDIEETK